MHSLVGASTIHVYSTFVGACIVPLGWCKWYRRYRPKTVSWGVLKVLATQSVTRLTERRKDLNG